MKRIHVKQYQVLINEENATCGVAINIDHYKKLKIDDYNLKYNNEIEIILHNCDKQFLYYALKTHHLGVILGKPNMITHQLVAEIK